MKIIFLGTNGWYDTKTGNTICALLETKRYFIILDAGNGIYKTDKYIKIKKPIFLFLSHFHFDHIIGLHILPKFKFNSDFKIFGQKGTKKFLEKLLNPPFSSPFKKLPYKVKFFELSEGRRHLPFLVKTKFLFHTVPVLGYRFEIDGKKIAYCPDTSRCSNLMELAKDTDLFITECGLRPGEKEKWGHLSPNSAAKIAKEVRTKKLILTHFLPINYKSLKERKRAEKVAKKIFKNTIAAYDDLEIEI
jgi:ribonuclease BN (tRNA processing enzyme)